MGHKLVKNQVAPEKKKNHIKLKILSFIITGLTVSTTMYMPINYSTFVNNFIIKDIETNLTGEVGGIVASEENIKIESTDYDIISSSKYILNLAEKALTTLEAHQELGLLKTNINVRDLWSIYYKYYADKYNKNLQLFEQLVLWYNNLQKIDTENYENICNSKECLFVNELSNIMEIDYNTIINSNAHKAYHLQLEQSVNQLVLTEDDLHIAYETYILTNPEYIKSVKLNLTLLNQKLIDEKPNLCDWAVFGNDHLVRMQLGNIKYKQEFSGEQLTELLKYIDLTLDEKVLSKAILPYVPNTFLAFSTDSNGFNSIDTSVINITGVENLEEWLLEHNNTSINKKQPVLKSNRLLNYGYAQLYWEIERIQHIENIPTFEQVTTDTELMKNIKLRLVEQTVWQMFYNEEREK